VLSFGCVAVVAGAKSFDYEAFRIRYFLFWHLSGTFIVQISVYSGK